MRTLHYTLLTDIPDESLWPGFTAGSVPAFEALYHRYFPLLMKRGRSLTPDPDLIKDCIHDLFICLWRHRQNLATPRCVRAYLHSSMARKLLREIRRQRRTPLFASPGEWTVDPAEKKLIARQTKEEQKSRLKTAMHVLTQRQREAVYLRFYEDMDYTTIACRMSITKDSTYNLISQAIHCLRPQMKKAAC